MPPRRQTRSSSPRVASRSPLGRLRHDYTGKTPLSGYAFVLPPRASGNACVPARDNGQECTKEALPMDVCLPPDEPPPSVASELVASKELESGAEGAEREHHSWSWHKDVSDYSAYEAAEQWWWTLGWKMSWPGQKELADSIEEESQDLGSHASTQHPFPALVVNDPTCGLGAPPPGYEDPNLNFKGSYVKIKPWPRDVSQRQVHAVLQCLGYDVTKLYKPENQKSYTDAELQIIHLGKKGDVWNH